MEVEEKRITFEKAFGRVASLCSQTEKCEFDIRAKLITMKLYADDIDKIIDNLIELNFIDEERYTNAFVNDKFKFNKWGKLKIISHLKNKKIQSKFITEAIKTIEEQKYITLAKELIKEKAETIKEENTYKAKAKIINFMASRGFEQELIMNIVGD